MRNRLVAKLVAALLFCCLWSCGPIIQAKGPDRVFALTFAGSSVWAIESSHLSVYDLRGKLERTQALPDSNIRCGVFGTQNVWTVSGAGKLTCFDPMHPERKTVFPGSYRNAFQLAISDRGKVGCVIDGLGFVDIVRTTSVERYRMPDDPIATASISEDGKRLFLGTLKGAYVILVLDKPVSNQLPVFHRVDEALRVSRFVPALNGFIASGWTTVWKIGTPTTPYRIGSHPIQVDGEQHIGCLETTGDGKVVAYMSFPTIVVSASDKLDFSRPLPPGILRVATPGGIKPIPGIKDDPIAIALDSSGKHLAYVRDGRVEVVDLS